MSSRSLTDERARQIADVIDAYDAEIATANEGKKDTFASVREELEGLGLERTAITAQLAAFKAAIAKRRKRAKDAEAVDERDALTDDYLDVLERRPSHVHDAHAPARTREASELSPAAPFSKAAVTQETGHVVRSAGAHPHSAPEEQPRGTNVQIERGDGEACEAVAEPPADDPLPAPSNSADQATTDARPEYSPRVQDQALPEHGRNGSPDTTVGFTGGHSTVEGEQLVETSGAGEESAISVDPALASDPSGPFSRPPLIRGGMLHRQIVADMGCGEDEADEFHAWMTAGRSPDQVRALVLQAREA